MLSLRHFILLSFFLHTFGVGFLGYNVGQTRMNKKEVVSVKVFADTEEERTIKTKKSEIEKSKQPLLSKNDKEKILLSQKEKIFHFKEKVKKEDGRYIAEDFSQRKFSTNIKNKVLPSEKTIKKQYASLKKENFFPVKKVIKRHDTSEFMGHSLFALSVAEKTIKKESLTGEALNPSFLEKVSYQSSPLSNHMGVKTLLQDETVCFQKPSGKENERADLVVDSVAGESDGFLSIIRNKIEQAKRYPLAAKEKGLEGTSSIRFRLRENGEVERIEIEKSSGKGILDRESIKTVKRAAPFPYIGGWIVVPLTYELTQER